MSSSADANGEKHPETPAPKRLKAGKLPVELLEPLLARIPASPRVLIAGGIGRDAAVIEFSEDSDRLLVAKTDPITFATDRIGWYAVNINANDIVCMGADPVGSSLPCCSPKTAKRPCRPQFSVRSSKPAMRWE